jgi:hypothetical protein
MNGWMMQKWRPKQRQEVRKKESRRRWTDSENNKKVVKKRKAVKAESRIETKEKLKK